MTVREGLARLRVSPPVTRLRYHAYRDVAVGFRVIVVDASRFEPEVVRDHVLAPPVPKPPPFDDHRRRIYFACA